MLMAAGGGRRGWVRGRCLGRGSTAEVYLAASTSGSEDRVFAVKSAELSRSPSLQREQKVLTTLCNPHIISCLGSDVTAEPDGRVLFNLFMEYVPGGDLTEVVKQRGGLDEHAIRVYTRGVLNGLAYLHGRGIVHCDVKGHNILVSEDGGSVKLADLGCARWIDDGSEGRVVISGTPLYMAPEVARGEEQGPTADIWALGCTVIEMATGCLPWHGIEDPVAAIHRIAFSDDVPEVPCNLSDDARDFLGRCLSRDPRQRWSAEELLHHPFVECCEEPAITDSKRNSPKSILDQGFWDSWQDDDSDVAEDDKAKTQMDDRLPESAQERLWQLVGDGVSPSPAAIATWEKSWWVTVRNGVGDISSSSSWVSSEVPSKQPFDLSIGQDEPSASSSASVVAAFDGGCGCDVELSDCSDCSVVIVEGYLPSINVSSHLTLNRVNIIPPCNIFLCVDHGNARG